MEIFVLLVAALLVTAVVIGIWTHSALNIFSLLIG
jgi:archaellum component FlaG (FlaF/FlaG flagellin family)